jgi:hypothetical protein
MIYMFILDARKHFYTLLDNANYAVGNLKGEAGLLITRIMP